MYPESRVLDSGPSSLGGLLHFATVASAISLSISAHKFGPNIHDVLLIIFRHFAILPMYRFSHLPLLYLQHMVGNTACGGE